MRKTISDDAILYINNRYDHVSDLVKEMMGTAYIDAVLNERERCAELVRQLGQTTSNHEALALFFRLETDIRTGSK